MLKSGIAGTIGAVVAVAITFLIADAISGPLLTVAGTDQTEEIPLAVALVSTVFGGAAGLTLAALCKRFLRDPATVFVGISIVGLVVFGIFPFMAADNTATAIWLNVMHIAAAVPILAALIPTLNQER